MEVLYPHLTESKILINFTKCNEEIQLDNFKVISRATSVLNNYVITDHAQ